MADVKWIKIVTDIFDDEKILFIEQLPEADSIIVIWFKLLSLAGKINNGGVLLFNDRLPYTDEMLSTIFRRPINTIRLALKTFEEFEMVEIINNTITIPNWSKHQSLDQLEERKEYMKNYMRDYREKQKQLANNECKVNSKVNSKANVSALEVEEEVEEERDIEIRDKSKDNIIILSDDENRFIETLSKIPKYPLDRERDLEMYNTMKKRYPTLDLLGAIEDWRLYKLDKPLKDNSNARSQINTSFKNYVSWGKCLKGENNGKKATRDRGADEGSDIAEQAGVLSF